MKIALWRLVAAAAFAALMSLAPCAAHAEDGVWTALGPFGGAVTAIEVSPLDPNLVWATTVNRQAGCRPRWSDTTGSVFRSTDGGHNWQPSNLGLQFEPVCDLEASPLVRGLAWVSTASGVYRSADTGGTWTFNAGRAQPFVELLADRVLANRLYARTGHDLFRSDDAGATWHRIRLGVAAMATGADGTLWVARGLDILTSRDGGTTWRRANVGSRPGQVSLLVLDPTSSPGRAVIWATVGRNVWRSDDSGRAWHQVGQRLPGLRGQTISRFVVRPDLPRVLYAAVGAVWRSTDRGATWRLLSGLGEPFALIPQHPGGLLFGSLFRTNDDGQHRTLSNTGLTASPSFQFAVDPWTPTRLLSFERSGENLRLRLSIDAGASWQPVGGGVPDPLECSSTIAFDPLVAGRVYLSTCSSILRSTDGGATWAIAGRQPAEGPCEALVGDRVQADRLLCVAFVGGAARTAQISDDAGASWRLVLARTNIVGVLAVPLEPQHLLAWGWAGSYLDPPTPWLVESYDAGLTWQDAEATLPGVPRDVGLLSSDPAVRLLVAGNGLYRQVNGGDWDLVLLDAPDHSPALAVTDDTVYVALGFPGRVRASHDGGVTWEDVGTGLEQVGDPYLLQVVAGSSSGDPDQLYTGSGGGIWRLDRPR